MVGVLRNTKYVGVWPWGKRTNVRNPLTGDVSQEYRSPHEAAQYLRERPELRIVDDDLFFPAQGLLDENQARMTAVRGTGGKVRGSTVNAHRPCHLLQGLVRCGACGATFKVAGSGGKYLGCYGYAQGRCGVKTRLLRVLAEKLLLARVGERLLGDSARLAAAGVRFDDVAAALGCHPTWPGKALAWWHLARGMTPPDGRTARRRLGASAAFVAQADRAMALWDACRLMKEIADDLGCCRDQVTKVIAHWHASRGLPDPDGRTRRKSLDRKSRPADGPTAAT